MLKRTILVFWIALASSLAVHATAFAEDAKFYFIDILKFKEGKTAADAAVYFDLIEPIIAKHGMKRAVPGLNIAKVMRGDIPEHIVNIWTITDPEGTLQSIFNDERYLENVSLRDSIFDLKNSKMMVLQPNS